jgi:hypothetical protein
VEKLIKKEKKMNDYSLTDGELNDIHGIIEQGGKSKRMAVDVIYQEIFARYIDERDPIERIDLARDLTGIEILSQRIFDLDVRFVG